MTNFERFCIARRGEMQARIERTGARLLSIKDRPREAAALRAQLALYEELIRVIETHERAPRMIHA